MEETPTSEVELVDSSDSKREKLWEWSADPSLLSGDERERSLS
jgi:hypothetical protein